MPMAFGRLPQRHSLPPVQPSSCELAEWSQYQQNLISRLQIILQRWSTQCHQMFLRQPSPFRYLRHTLQQAQHPDFGSMHANDFVQRIRIRLVRNDISLFS